MVKCGRLALLGYQPSHTSRCSIINKDSFPLSLITFQNMTLLFAWHAREMYGKWMETWYIIFMILLGLIWASSLGHWCLTGSDSLPVHGGGTAGAPCHPCHSSPQAKADQHPNLWRIYGGFMEDLSGLILVILPNNGWWCYVIITSIPQWKPL